MSSISQWVTFDLGRLLKSVNFSSVSGSPYRVFYRGLREYRYRLGTAVLKSLVSDLVLFMTKSQFRFLIWHCLVSNLSLGFGFGISLGLFSVLLSHYSQFGTGLNLSFCAHWFMFDFNATLVIYL